MKKTRLVLALLLLFVLVIMCLSTIAHAQGAPAPNDSEVQACMQNAPDLLLSARLAKQSLINSSLSGNLHDTGFPIARVYQRQIASCAEVGGRMIASSKAVPPDLEAIQRENTDLLFLLEALQSTLPPDLDKSNFPNCRKVLDSGIIDRARNFIDAINAANASTVTVGDVMPYENASHDLILCGAEATKHGMPGASSELFNLVAGIDELMLIADTNSEAQLLKNLSPTGPGRPIKIQIQVLPSPARRARPSQSCSGTVYGEGPTKRISWSCF